MPNSNVVIAHSAADSHDASSITELFADLRSGRREAFDKILPLVFSQPHIDERDPNFPRRT